MREIGCEEWVPIKVYSDLMFRKEEIVPLQHNFRDILDKGEHVFLISGEITHYHEPNYPKLKLKKIDNGKLLLTNKGLVFIKKRDAECIKYPFEIIRGRSTEKNFIFQIVYRILSENDTLIHSVNCPAKKDLGRFVMRNESCLKWELYFDQVLKEISTRR